MLANGSYGDLLELLTSHLELLFEQTEASDVECCANVLCHLVPRVEPTSASVTAACNLTDKLASSTTQKQAFRLQARPSATPVPHHRLGRDGRDTEAPPLNRLRQGVGGGRLRQSARRACQ